LLPTYCSVLCTANLHCCFLQPQGRLTGCTAAASCPNVPGVIILSENATSTAEYCLSVASNACPSAQLYNDRSFPLFSGVTATGAPRLRRCIKPIVSPECNTTGTYTARVQSTADGSGIVVGCMTTTPATPCPISSPFFYMGSDLAVVECRPGVPAACNATAAPFNAYTVRMVSADGGTLQGCMQAGAKRCPVSAAPTNDAYNHPFFLLGDGQNVDECRQAGFVITDCAANFTSYRGSSNTYDVEYISNTTMGGTGGIAGCAKSSVACSAAVGFPVAQVSAAGAIEACRPANTNCTGSYPLQLQDATGATTQGCAPTLSDCPSTGWWTFGLYARTSTTAAAAKLMSCRSVTAGSLTNCSSAAFTGYPVELLNAAGALAGCSAVDAQVRLLLVRLTKLAVARKWCCVRAAWVKVFAGGGLYPAVVQVVCCHILAYYKH
jgi:hypothetical protein